MKKYTIQALVAFLVFSLACQTLTPATLSPGETATRPPSETEAPPRDGTVINNCTDVVKAVRGLQTNDVPKGLMETGTKQGDEFDPNAYFNVLPNLSMQEGYVLDYVFMGDSLGSFPILAARPTDQPPFISATDLPPGTEFADYLDHVEVKDVEQGYFEFTSLSIMARQFYLVWHANYNDTEVICDREAVDAIAAERATGDFGMKFDDNQLKQIKELVNIEPLVKLTDSTATVEMVTFSKWGGFYRMAYTIDRAFPHKIIDTQEENIIHYDCGIMF